MIVSSCGLEAITTDKQYLFLSDFLQKSFRAADVEDLLRSMMDMEQYFFFSKQKPVAVVSFKKKGFLQCTSSYYRNTLYNVATAPYYRKRGYMKKLLSHVIRQKKKQRLRYLHLEVQKENTKAIRLYQSLGFEIIHECETIYVMRLCLWRRRHNKASSCV